jgi:TonB family protein
VTAEPILRTLLEANLAAGAAVLLVLLLRHPLRARCGAAAAYGLWLLPPVAALGSLIPARVATVAPTAEIGDPVAAAAGVVLGAPAPAALTFDVASILVILWLAGAAAFAALAVYRSWRLASDPAAGPALVGVIRPRLVLPADFATRFDAAERRLILAHEAIHSAGRHPAINGLVEAARCLNWFNPLIHVAAFYARVDQELACDAAVVARHPAERRTYAEALLKSQLSPAFLPLGCQWPGRTKPLLTERIEMLARPRASRARQVAAAAAIAMASAGAAYGAWAAQPPRAPAEDAAVQAETAPRPGAGLEPDAAQKLARPGQEVECKPDTNRELHDCQVVATPWAKIATAADVAQAWPSEARGRTADVFLECNVAGTALADCHARKVYAAGLSTGQEAAFEAAAVKVAGVYRLKPEAKMPSPMFMTIQFRPNPAMTGGPVTGPLPRKAPPDLPMPAAPVGKPPVAAQLGAPQPEVAKALWAAGGRAAGTPAEPLVTQPDWVRRPEPADVVSAYPPEALRNGLAGSAIIACEVAATGTLEKCQVAREEPEGAGFGQAALAMSGQFQMKPASRDGRPVAGGRVRIPIRFMLPVAK